MVMPRDTGGLGGLPPGTTPADPPAGDPTFNPTVGRPPTGGSYERRSAAYNRPYPVVYGTAASQAVPLIAGFEPLDHDVALDGSTTTRMRCAYAAYALAVGPIAAIEGILYEKRRYGTGALDLKYLSRIIGGAWMTPPETFLGDGTTTAWSGFPNPTQWKSLATFRCNFLGVPGGAGQVPELRALVRGLYATHSNTKRTAGGWTPLDAAPGDVIRDLLENTVYGLGLPAGTVVTAVGSDGTAASSFDRYCEQNGWWIALAIDASISVAEVVAQILTATNSVGFWSGPNFKIIPLGDTAVGTFAPVLTAVGLGEDDWVAPQGQDAIRVTRRPVDDCYNVVPVEASLDTALRDAELVPVEFTDAASVAAHGLRRSPSPVQLPCIRSKTHALEISGILARASFYLRNLYEFTISARQGAALEPGDLVALTHAPMGITDRLARVERIEVSPEGGTYRVEAREWVTGTAVTVTYTPPGPDGLGNTPTPAADSYGTIGDMANDGKLTPVEKPAFFNHVGQLWQTDREMEASVDVNGGWLPAAAAISLISAFGDFWDYLALLGFDGGWCDIDRVWLDPGDRATQRAALDAWMAVTTDLEAWDLSDPEDPLLLRDAETFRQAFVDVQGAVADYRALQLSYARPPSVAPAFYGAAGDGAADDSAALQAALSSGAAVIDGGGKTYHIHTAITVPAGVTLRNANLEAGTAGMNMVLVNTRSKVLGVKLTGTGTTSTVERGIYPAADGVTDVELDVEVCNLTYGVHAQPTSTTTPKRWYGKVYAHEIVGTTGTSEGYGLLLSPAEGCTFEVRAVNIKRHAVYLSAGASFNDIRADVDCCGNVAIQLYSTDSQAETRHNRIRGSVRNLFVPTGQAAGQAAGVYLIGRACHNDVKVAVYGTAGTTYGTGTAGAEHAVVVEGFQGSETNPTSGNEIVGCTLTGSFSGADVIRLLNDDGTIVADNQIKGYAANTAIALRRVGTDSRRTVGPQVYGNRIDCQGYARTGIYDEVLSANTYVGPNEIRNNSTSPRVDDQTSGKRTGWSREETGQTTVACSANASASTAVTWAQPIAGARVTATVVSNSVSGSGSFPAYATGVTTTGANIAAYNGNGSAQTLTVDYRVTGD